MVNEAASIHGQRRRAISESHLSVLLENRRAMVHFVFGFFYSRCR
jgi:hypothetical protein